MVVAMQLVAVHASPQKSEAPDILLFFQAASPDEEQAEEALAAIGDRWHDGYASLLVDLARLFPADPVRPPAFTLDAEAFAERAGSRPTGTPPSVRARTRARLIHFLGERTGRSFGDDLNRWREWIWSRPYAPHPDYRFFKAVLYGHIDRRMVEFFRPDARALIRLDEVVWGGVGVNSIPPLDHPKRVAASEAGYLGDDDVVFGVTINGDSRAYPKRILAWHEMARDRVGDVELAIVYCTLCGTVIPYGAEVGGRLRTLGTSGLLYRSNKLMFDEETMSLWSTLEGRPVIGELAGGDLELRAYPVVSTTWREWSTLHPETTVLSLDTGHKRDYSEGAAYRDYFGTDRLMFAVPRLDQRLGNKDEVLAILLRPGGASATEAREALALSVAFLEKNPVYHVRLAGHDLVVATSREGANRVYAARSLRFVRQERGQRLIDSEGRAWRLTEEALVSEDPSMAPLPRVPARRAFWFGWFAQFPDTRLIR